MTRRSILLRPLVNPGAEETDLLRSERLDAGLVLQRRHPLVLIVNGMGHRLDDEAVCAVARRHNLPFLGALEHAFERVHMQPGLWLIATVAFDAGSVENRLHIGGIGHTRLGGCRGQVSGRGSQGKASGCQQGAEREFGHFYGHF